MLKVRIEAGAYIAMSGYLLLMPPKWVLSALMAATVHELGHCAALWAFGIKIYEIRVGAFGARIETEPTEGREGAICALAGPLAGMLVCLFWRWMPGAAVCALVQTAFNLMPVYPFDGGRALECLRHKAVAKSVNSVYNKPD